MTVQLPLIRAAVLFPIRRWCDENGLDTLQLLTDVDLGWVERDDPMAAVPLLNVVALVKMIARKVGPDAPMRIIDRRAPLEIGLIGAAMAKGNSLADGFHEIPKAMHTHCTHEFLTVHECDGTLNIGEGWTSIIGDEEDFHLVQQFVLAMVNAICGLAGTGFYISEATMLPHPDHGLTHLEPWFGNRIHTSRHRLLNIEIPMSVANRPVKASERVQLETFSPRMIPALREENTLAGSVTALLRGMVPTIRPNIEHIVRATGASQRTLQRRLAEEGFSFSELLDRALANHVLARLSEKSAPKFGDLAAELGYSDPAAFTRAVRRWYNETPSQLKERYQIR